VGKREKSSAVVEARAARRVGLELLLFVKMGPDVDDGLGSFVATCFATIVSGREGSGTTRHPCLGGLSDMVREAAEAGVVIRA
jgi:hypothetical protein